MWLLTPAHAALGSYQLRGGGGAFSSSPCSSVSAGAPPCKWRCPRRFLCLTHIRPSVSASEDASAADGEKTDETFLTMEEAGLIELSTLDMHERFLCRLTVSSLNLLRVISKQEGMPIEQLNAGIICDWFQKDKEKREKDFNSATLKW